ncbi:MAG: hypothetical protein OK456_04495 [Thaumarchaeota archaeon]|nr:hypothetical protein [Nitrososphaerota archaeon]
MRGATYGLEKLASETVMVSSASRARLAQVDSVVFDCDGVLIDASRSYDAAILITAESMLEGFSGTRLPLERVGGEYILRIRRTGGFNDDWETTYALAILSMVALEPLDSAAANKDRAKKALLRLDDLIGDFSSRKRLRGRVSLDEYLAEGDLETPQVEELRAYLDAPTDPAHSRMTATFDETYYGSKLFERIYGLEASGPGRRGLIDNEEILLSEARLGQLEKILGGRRMAMATGRPLVAVQYTMGRLLRFFDQEASMFIGDGDVKPDMVQELRKYRKPSGLSLVRARQKLSSETMLYIGDSAEDRLMVDDARKTSDGLLFGGVYGTSFNQEEQMSYFAQSGADVVMRKVGSTPALLRRLKA